LRAGSVTRTVLAGAAPVRRYRKIGAQNLKDPVSHDLLKERSTVLLHERFFIETFPKGLS
jgi:hypothetical protein